MFQESVIQLDFAGAYSSVHHFWIFHLSLLAHDVLQQYYTNEICKENQETLLHGQRRQARLSDECVFFAMAVDPFFFFVGSRTQSFPKNLAAPDLLHLAPCAYADGLSPASVFVHWVAGKIADSPNDEKGRHVFAPRRTG